jgi:hypothetical protein
VLIFFNQIAKTNFRFTIAVILSNEEGNDLKIK